MRRRRSNSYYTPRQPYYETRRSPRRRRRGSSPWPRFFYGVAVLAGGVTGAWHYHKNAEPSAQPTIVAQGETAEEDIKLELVAPTPVVPDAPWDAQEAPSEPNAQREKPIAPRASLDTSSSPPGLAAAFEPLALGPTRGHERAEPEKADYRPITEPIQSKYVSEYKPDSNAPRDEEWNAKPEVENTSEKDVGDTEEEDTEDRNTKNRDTEEDESKSRPTSTKTPPKTVEVARPRQHRVVDGDTLANLAERYLGNANRWQLIYDTNRSVLTSSDWLPVGITLAIPAAAPHASTQSGAETEMVPIPANLLYPDL